MILNIKPIGIIVNRYIAPKIIGFNNFDKKTPNFVHKILGIFKMLGLKCPIIIRRNAIIKGQKVKL